MAKIRYCGCFGKIF